MTSPSLCDFEQSTLQVIACQRLGAISITFPETLSQPLPASQRALATKGLWNQCTRGTEPLDSDLKGGLLYLDHAQLAEC